MNLKSQKITNLIRQTTHQVDDKAEVILFGSRARGDERQDSELETAESFSLFVYSKNEWTTKHRITPFYNSISQEVVQL